MLRFPSHRNLNGFPQATKHRAGQPVMQAPGGFRSADRKRNASMDMVRKLTAPKISAVWGLQFILQETKSSINRRLLAINVVGPRLRWSTAGADFVPPVLRILNGLQNFHDAANVKDSTAGLLGEGRTLEAGCSRFYNMELRRNNVVKGRIMGALEKIAWHCLPIYALAVKPGGYKLYSEPSPIFLQTPSESYARVMPECP
ncbi:hypothetical protein DFH09DRAFT_1088049 [Mycena vulgaris]|nr:hypothetical protein DFH09DRAFT_1088049 [Mycena vulgaris]